MSAAAGKLYVADTNNHAIRVADLETGEVSTLDLRGLYGVRKNRRRDSSTVQNVAY